MISLGGNWETEKRIGDLAGLREKTVRKGIKNLEASNILKVSWSVSSRGNRLRNFHVRPALPQFNTNSHRNYSKAPFPFYSSIILSTWRCWKDLTRTAKALYPVMRYFAFNEKKYSKEEYLQRDFDCCTAKPDVLAEYAGITKRSLKSAINSLAANDLVEEIEESHGTAWHVYLRPEMPF